MRGGRLDVYCDGDGIQDGESRFVLVGEGTGEQLQPVNGAVDGFAFVGARTQL